MLSALTGARSRPAPSRGCTYIQDVLAETSRLAPRLTLTSTCRDLQLCELMRIRIAHSTHYAYDAPARSILQALRLTPRPHEGQHVTAWRIETDADVRLRPEQDVFGNLVHMLQCERPGQELGVRVEGEVETRDTCGVVRGALERLPRTMYLRETALTRPSPELRDFARATAETAGPDPLARLHALLSAVHREIALDAAATDAATPAGTAFQLKRGVCQDMAHVFIAGARSLGIPARYVSGHLVRADAAAQDAAHAWAEAHVDGLGWVAFDPANGVCATDAYVRVAIGLDYLGAAPVRGAVYGGGRERRTVSVSATDAAVQPQA
jgi:transglutaminase-like putative cysteine protease